VIAGALWDIAGPSATFAAGAGFAVLTLLALGWQRHRLRPAARPGR
jgi:hypothetical protein